MPGSLKSKCAQCGVKKWNVDYKEGCEELISSLSKCLFCEQANKIEKLEKEVRGEDDEIRKLKGLLSNLEKKVTKEVETLKKVMLENRDTIVETGRDVVQIREQIRAVKKNTEELQTIVNAEGMINPERNGQDHFMKARGRMVTTRKYKEQPKNETAVRNRFSLLTAEEEEETVLIGDSMVKDQGKHFGLKNKNKRKVRSYPGASTKKLKEEIGKMKTEKKTTVIIQASGNDLFLRNGNAGPTEPLMMQLEDTIRTARNKTNKAIVLGIIPRINVSHYALSKAIGINDRLKSICHRNGVRFVNLWDTFYGNRKLFKRDGIHFSLEGMKIFGNRLNQELYDNLRNPIDTGHTELPENPRNSNGENIVDSVITQGNE